jgi:hypothetical protein
MVQTHNATMKILAFVFNCFSQRAGLFAKAMDERFSTELFQQFPAVVLQLLSHLLEVFDCGETGTQEGRFLL